MTRHKIKSDAGITLVELLATLAIFSLVSVIIIGYLVGGMKSFTRTNADIAIHDEANYIMSQFVNYIFVATNVEKEEDSSVINVTDFDGSIVRLGFEGNQAIVKNSPVHQSKYCITDDSEISVEGEKVKIKMVIVEKEDPDGDCTNENSERKLELNSEVSFVKVD